jgi:hypothetical protein
METRNTRDNTTSRGAGSAAGTPRPSDAWLFAQAILGASVSDVSDAEARAERAQLEWLAEFSTEHEGKLRRLLSEEAAGRERQERLERFAEISTFGEGEWDPDRHPRGGYPQNRGWWSPASGAPHFLTVSDKSKKQGSDRQPQGKVPPISIGVGNVETALAEEKEGSDEQSLKTLVDLLKAGGAKLQNGQIFVGSVKAGASFLQGYLAVLQLNAPGSKNPIIAERFHTTRSVGGRDGKFQVLEEKSRILELFPTDASGKATISDPVSVAASIPRPKGDRIIVAQYDRQDVTFYSGTTAIDKKPRKEWTTGFKAWTLKEGEDPK